MTETIENLATALAAFQGEMPVVAKSHTARVAMKGGGQYSYTYADLADVSEAAMPLLSKHGLSFSALPGMGDRGYELRGVLIHKSGETIEGSLPINGNSPQEMGSSLTYMRRYLLGCLTGIVTDDDDDGRHAEQAAKRPVARKAGKAVTPPPPVEPPSERAFDNGGHPIAPSPMTSKTRAHMFALFAKHKIDDRDEQIRGINHILGREVTSRGELLESEAKQVVAQLEQRQQPAGASA